MRKQKVLALVLSLVMVVSMLASCGKTENTDTETDEVSIDFEDSKSGFALVKSFPRKADDSNLSVKTVNDTKVLYMENTEGNSEAYLALDLDGLLGENISKLAKVEMTIGVDRPTETKFAAIAGETYVYAGATVDELAETKVGEWSVYSSSKNPATFTFDVSSVTFTAGADSYMTILKNDDTSATMANFYVDNIKFLDADGKLIACNKDDIMEPVGAKFTRVPEEPDLSAGITVTDDLVSSDWGQDGRIPVDTLKQFSGMNVEITMTYDAVAGADQSVFAPMDASWAKIYTTIPGSISGLTEGYDIGCIKPDGFIVCDPAKDTITFTLSADGVAYFVDNGVDFSGQAYGLDVASFKLKQATSTSITETVVDELTASDWGQDGKIPASVLAEFSGLDVTVTMTYDANASADQCVFAPMDASWAKIYTTIPGSITGLTEGTEYGNIKTDGFIICDPAKDTITFTLTAAGVAYFVDNSVDFSGQSYGLDVVQFKLEATTGASSSVTEKVTGDSAYTGDWTLGGTVPSAVLAEFSGDVTVTLKFELTGDKDYYIACPIDSWWADKFGANGEITDLEVMAAADAENPTYHLQADGGIVIDNFELTELTYTLSAAAVQQMVADGKDLAAMVYGVTIYEIVLTGGTGDKVSEKVTGDDAYTGDWTLGGTVPSAVLAEFSGDVKVTLKFELTGDKDYYIACPIDSWWADKFGANGEITDLEVMAAADAENPTYHLQADGGIVIDNFELTELTYTLSAAAVQQMVADGKDLAAMVYGVTIYEIIVEDN